MNMAKHTPGPWHMSRPLGTGHLEGKEPWFRVSADRTLFLDVRACSDGFVIGENEANARLIAAAPELLNILRKCRDYLSCIPESSAGGDDDAVMLAQEASSVIAKATGETP